MPIFPEWLTRLMFVLCCIGLLTVLSGLAAGLWWLIHHVTII